MRYHHVLSIVTLLIGLTGHTVNAYAQAAGACCAGSNKAERAKIQEQEQKRLERVDLPIRPDPVGNALIGGVVTGTIKGAAAGTVSSIRGAVVGSTVQNVIEDIQKSKEENKQSGRGGPSDPRYDPRTLLDLMQR
jgi:hypothetical protein